MLVSFITLDLPDFVDDLLRVEVGPSDAGAQATVEKEGERQGVSERDKAREQVWSSR